jgi:pyrroline-5-carboxylate reductase
MGEAFVGAVIRSNIFEPAQILASDVDQGRRDHIREVYGISVTRDNVELFTDCDIVVLAVKPQEIHGVLAPIAERKGYRIPRRKLVITIAAGIPIRKIEDILYAPLDDQERAKLPIMRAMPNTPALVLSGMAGMSANGNAREEDVGITRTILEAMGRVLEFKEEDLDAVTALSGNGPAYVFYLIESMIEGGINVGLDPDDAAVLTMTTLKGALKLIEERNESPERLRQKVTSPGGTTEASFRVLEYNRVKAVIIEAIAAGARRSKQLSLELKKK